MFELAGHYVPNLVQQVVHHNAEPGAFFLNLKGFAVLPFHAHPSLYNKNWEVSDDYDKVLGLMTLSHKQNKKYTLINFLLSTRVKFIKISYDPRK